MYDLIYIRILKKLGDDEVRVAIFDFDGTVYKKETFRVMMNHLKNHPIYKSKYNRFFMAMLPPYLGYKIKLYPENKMKERSMQLYLSAFENLSEKEIYTYFEEVAEYLQKDFNSKVIERLEKHVTDNVHTMIVSGAYTPMLQTAVKGFPFDDIIGTDIPMQNQKYNNKAPIQHINGKRKNEKILAALKGMEVDWENSFAYADSYSDLSVLELVGNPVAVQPEQRLLDIAKERGWEIM